MIDATSVGVFRGRGVQPFAPKMKVGTLHVMCGSWNPLHDAHRWMYESIDMESTIVHRYSARGYAVVATTSAKYFELSTVRVGKENLTDAELMSRLRQFQGYANVLVTAQPYFADKCAILQPYADQIVFHIGYDNYERLIQITGASEISKMPCTFCVWPRNGDSFTAGPKNCFDSGIELPAHLQGMSSTKIREAQGGK